MIDRQIIESAKIIRKKFLSIISETNNYQGDVKQLSEFLMKKVEDLKNIKDNEFKNKPTQDEVNRVTKLILKEIGEIEIEEQKLSKKISTLNEEIEKLKKEEDILYRTIKNRYPNLSDKQIKEEIQSNLEQ
jgi:hypothetical protein